MKKMSDRKMDMGGGSVDSDGFFPSEAKHKILAKPGKIKDFKYPDTEEMVKRDQDEAVRDTNKNLPKTGYRH